MSDTGALSGALARVLQAQELAEKLADHSEGAHGEASREYRASCGIVEHLQAAARGMTLAGILPGADGKVSSGLDLSDLAALNAGRQEAAELAQKLGELLPLAEKLDRLRGRSVSAKVPLGPEEVAGCDVADVLNDLRLRLLSESETAPGKGWE